MPEITIRLLGPDDARPFAALRRQGLAEAPLAFASSLEDDITADLETTRKALRRSEDAADFGAFVGDELIGVAGIGRGRKVKTRHKAVLWGTYVAPEHRGKGLARRLLETAIERAREMGASAVHLSVAEPAAAARRLYESLGFVRWGTEPDAICHEGKVVDEDHMVLRLEA